MMTIRRIQMTNDEASKRLGDLKYYEGVHALITPDVVDAIGIAQSAIYRLEEIEPYRTPKKVIMEDGEFPVRRKYTCPTCGKVTLRTTIEFEYPSFCDRCGQKLDWRID